MKTQRDTVLHFLYHRYGSAPDAAIYEAIDTARDWWAGRYEPFHVFTETGQHMSPIRREMYKMGMAKKICEDWATILVNDRTNLRCDDAQTAAVLFGDRFGVGGILTHGNFWGRLNTLTEETFALGTGAAVAHFTDAVCGEDGFMTSAGGMELSFCTADQIFPMRCEGGEVVCCAFLGTWSGKRPERAPKDVPLLFLTVHEKIRRGKLRSWKVENYLIAVDGSETGRALPLPGGILKSFFSPVPLFALLTPNLVPCESVLRENGMGASVFASAYDNLKGVDLAYNNFCRDLFLGGKKVFLNQNLVQEDAYGRRIAPDDVAQQLFMTVGDGDLAADTMIMEHNPQLRAEENTAAVQAQLDYLSFKVGFGTRHYRFSGETVVTATQYAGDKQELLQHAMKHYLHMECFLRRLTDMAYYYASCLCGYMLAPLGRITVDFDDSFFIDPTAERERDLREVAAGLLSKWEYRMKYYGESEDAAKHALASL